MLIKITNHCSLGCTHCMENSTVLGEHMTEAVFARALDFTRRAERIAWSLGCPPMILLSGGECTEHPRVVQFVEEVIAQRFVPVLLTNGMWLDDEELRSAVLRPGRPILVQVTNDPRFYPREPPEFRDERVVRVPALTHLIPLGRAARGRSADAGVPPARAPSSFNLRSLTRSLGNFESAVAMLRVRTMQGLSGHCTPSITEAGDVVAGETRECFRIGTVESSMEEVTRNLIEMRCNRCGLVDGLSREYKRAIGELSITDAREEQRA